MVSGRPPQATARRVISARPRVISAAIELCPSFESVANAGGNSNNVFQGAAEFDAGNIIIRVEAKTGIAEFALHDLCEIRVLRSDRDCCWVAARHLFRERRPAKGADTR